MLEKLFIGTTLGFVSLFTLAGVSYGSPSEPVTVDVYGSSYSVELDPDATDQVLRNQPWWGNRELASELCEALVYEGEDIASVGYNTMEISGEDYIEAYLVMPLATCSGPVLISQEDIGRMNSGTFFVVSGNLCFTSTQDSLSAGLHKNQTLNQNLYLTPQNASVLNCGYLDHSIFY